MKRKVFTVIAVMALAALAFLYAPIGLPGPYHGNSSTIGEIKAPSGYERIAGDDPKYTEYLRSIPLKDNGTPVIKYTAEKASAATQARSYAVQTLPFFPTLSSALTRRCTSGQTTCSGQDSTARYASTTTPDFP